MEEKKDEDFGEVGIELAVGKQSLEMNRRMGLWVVSKEIAHVLLVNSHLGGLLQDTKEEEL